MEKIAGYFIAWFTPETALGLWATVRQPIWQGFLYVYLSSSISQSALFLGTGVAESYLSKKIRWQINFPLWTSLQMANGKSLLSFRKKLRKKLVSWILRRRNAIIIALGFIPLLPVLPGAVLVAAKLSKIRYALPILLLANIFRTAVLCLVIYKASGAI